MYLEHFGLTELPFTLTPNTAFFYDQGGHREALNVLLVALGAGEGFIKITGEVGTGKTLLCRQLLKSLGEDVVSAYIPNPFLNPNALRMALADELGIEFARNIGQHRLLKLLTERLVALTEAGQRIVLVIDEAQAMPHETLEAVRLLTNLETERRKLLQVVMFGQPELDQRLAEPNLRQLRQRVSFAYSLHPLTRDSMGPYIEHRLRAAGLRGAPPFSAGAQRALFRGSRGVPRLVNILAHKSLMAAFGQGLYQVSARHVRRAVADTDDARRSRSMLPWLLTAVLLGTSGAVLALEAWS